MGQLDDGADVHGGADGGGHGEDGREGRTERVHFVTRYPPSSLGFRLGLGLVGLSF